MIAKVRIAPVERWCGRALRELERWPESKVVIGREVEIIPSSMTVDLDVAGGKDEPGTRFWQVSEQTQSEIISAIGEQRGAWVCEHLLEMD